MGTMKVSELTGAKLAEWVARALGYQLVAGQHPYWQWRSDGNTTHNSVPLEYWMPHENWDQGGPILDNENISFWKSQNWEDGELGPIQIFAGYNLTGWDGQVWYGNASNLVAEHEQTGVTKLEAAMRSFVASKYGEEVPDEA